MVTAARYFLSKLLLLISTELVDQIYIIGFSKKMISYSKNTIMSRNLAHSKYVVTFNQTIVALCSLLKGRYWGKKTEINYTW